MGSTSPPPIDLHHFRPEAASTRRNVETVEKQDFAPTVSAEAEVAITACPSGRMSASGSESAFGPMSSADARYLSPMTEPHVRDLPARTYVGERSTVAMDEFAAT